MSQSVKSYAISLQNCSIICVIRAQKKTKAKLGRLAREKQGTTA
jgi:hypothetical protein